jgi:DNA-nicking Smr family endonuclease
LRAVRPQLVAPPANAPTPRTEPASRRRPKTAPPQGRASATPDLLATVVQPVNPPLPSPLAEALAPLREALPARAAKRGPATKPGRPRQPTALPAASSFAELMREQDRRPPPQALLDKLSSSLQHSIDPRHLSIKRETSHTAFKNTENPHSDFALPSGSHRTEDEPAQPATRQASGLPGLKAIQKAMKARAAESRAQEARQRSAQQASQAQRRAFLQGVGAVTPLAPVDRVLHHQPREPVPTQRLLDEQAVLRESLSDEFDAGSLLDTDEKLSFLRPGVSLDVARRLRRGEWTIQKQVDLHGLRTDEARETLGQFIRESHRAGVRCVRVIHGKGLGSPGKAPVLKTRVQRWLVQKAEVMAFVQANPNQGGDGAVVVLLRPAQR